MSEANTETKSASPPRAKPPSRPPDSRHLVSFILIVLLLAAGIGLFVWERKISYTLFALVLCLLGSIMYRGMRRRDQGEGVIFYSHSQLLYYWPVWLCSFLFADLSAFLGEPTTLSVLEENVETMFSPNPHIGLVFIIVLFLVILFTNVNIRGVWALFVGSSVLIVALLFSVLDVWPVVLKFLGDLRMFINRDCYLALGILLFLHWFIVIFFFDIRRYMNFSPAHVKLVHEIGEGEKGFDSLGVTLEKKRDNFFQHLLLGWGSGDLQVTTSGGQRDIIVFPNVLRVDYVLKRVQDIREIRGRGPI